MQVGDQGDDGLCETCWGIGVGGFTEKRVHHEVWRVSFNDCRSRRGADDVGLFRSLTGGVPREGAERSGTEGKRYQVGACEIAKVSR